MEVFQFDYEDDDGLDWLPPLHPPGSPPWHLSMTWPLAILNDVFYDPICYDWKLKQCNRNIENNENNHGLIAWFNILVLDKNLVVLFWQEVLSVINSKSTIHMVKSQIHIVTFRKHMLIYIDGMKKLSHILLITNTVQ